MKTLSKIYIFPQRVTRLPLPNLPSHALHLIRTLGFEIRFDAPTLVDETPAIVAPPPKKEREHDMFRDFLLIRNHFYLHPAADGVQHPAAQVEPDIQPPHREDAVIFVHHAFLLTAGGSSGRRRPRTRCRSDRTQW